MTAPAAVVSGDCTHEDWTAVGTMYRDRDTDDGPIIAWSIELTATCAGCGAPMLWQGPASIDVSPDRQRIMLPCEPHPPGARS